MIKFEISLTARSNPCAPSAQTPAFNALWRRLGLWADRYVNQNAIFREYPCPIVLRLASCDATEFLQNSSHATASQAVQIDLWNGVFDPKGGLFASSPSSYQAKA
jgi:hypothetical protein